MPLSSPVRLGIAGLGGYAGSVRQAVQTWGRQSQPQVTLAAVCDPALDQHHEVAAELKAQGVAVHAEFASLLADPTIEAVWLPLPIDLHRPFTEQALAAGKAVMCEKPAAGVLQDVDAMIAARDRAGRPVAIGYQSIYDPRTLTLKKRVLNGELGPIRHARVHALWPRDTRYFGRSDWAGKLKRGDTWVLDSPANNAVAHYINLPLYLLGESLDTSAIPVRIEAELYRAAEIENYDTCSFRIHLSNGADLLVIYSHACVAPAVGPVVELLGEKKQAILTVQDVMLQDESGAREVITSDRSAHACMVDRFAKLVRGVESPDVGCATLEVARAQSLVASAASEAAGIVQVPDHQISIHHTETGGIIRAIRDIGRIVPACIARNQMLHESGLLDFSQPAGVLDLHGYHRFSGPKTNTPTASDMVETA